MFVGFFQHLRAARIPVTLREYLTLLEALDRGLAGYDVEHFYYLARACLVKDERYLDRFDLVFSNEVMEHVDDDRKTAAEMVRVPSGSMMHRSA